MLTLSRPCGLDARHSPHTLRQLHVLRPRAAALSARSNTQPPLQPQRRAACLPAAVPPSSSSDSRPATEATPATTAAAAAAGAAGAAAATAAAPKWVWEASDDAFSAYGAFFLWLAVGSLPELQSLQQADLPYFIGLAILTVYIGSHRGLTSSSKQQLQLKEGVLAPVLASCSLFGLYLVIKYTDFSLQSFLDVYFWLLGSMAITNAARPLLSKLSQPLGPQLLQRLSFTWEPPEGLLLDEQGNSLPQVRVAPSDVAAVLLAVGLATTELLGHHTNFTLNNMIACLVATEILALVGLRSFRVAAVLLTGLMAYDLFWVFGSPKVVGDNVMLQVATSDLVLGPTRLLFPRVPGGVGEAASFPFSLLGLGDIAIPGLLAGLALRFDASRMINMEARAVAAMAAMTGALAAVNEQQPEASARQMGNMAADAALAAYDQVADREEQCRDRSTNSSSSTATTSSSSTNSSAAEQQQQPAEAGEESQSQPLPVSPEVLEQRTYFNRVAAAHVVGLLAAFAANAVTHLGQPALLYIVPATLTTVLATAATRNEVGRVFQFTDLASFGVPTSSGQAGK